MLGISRVEQRSGGGLTVRASPIGPQPAMAMARLRSGYGQGNGQQYGQGLPQLPVDLTSLQTDYRGFVVDVDIAQAQSNYGQVYGQNYTP